jgi:agmatinase
VQRFTTAAVDGASIAGAIDGLRESGLLLSADQTVRSAPGARGLFGAPFTTVGPALNGEFDAIVVGVEYDAGASQRGGSRSAPDALRRAGGSLFSAAGGGGMYDPVRGRRVFRDVRLADIGNFTDTVQTRNGDMFDRLEEFAAACSERGKLSVAIGGDHSISFGLVAGHLRNHPQLGIIHIDAHSDYLEPMRGDWRQSLHHGNVMSWLAGRRGIATIAQFGIRQLTEEDPVPSDIVLVWPGSSALKLPTGIVAHVLDRSIPWYLSIDVDVLDPAFLPSTGTPLPGGLTPSELFDLLELVCEGRRVVGIDLVELIPSDSGHSSLLAAEVLLRAVDAAIRR